MSGFHHCTVVGCNRKYKTKERCEKHIQQCRASSNLESDLQASSNDLSNNSSTLAISSSLYKTKYFYLCTELNCNRKYKQAQRLVDHLLDAHQIINPSVPEPVLITKETKNIVERNRNNLKRQEERQMKIAELERQKQLESEAKRTLEEKYKEEYEQLEKLRLENEKKNEEQRQLQLRLEEEERIRKITELEREKKIEEKLKQELEAKYKEEYEKLEKMKLEKERVELELIKNIQTRIASNPETCSICFDSPSDTAVVPCGHKFFCYDCIVNYKFSKDNATCPMCRTKIDSVIKIFS